MDPITEWIARLGWIFDVWLFALGAAVGSFLNVVAYRVPAGKSIVHPGSQCPACGHPIRWYHNLPIVSWLWLRGKCHDCRARISVRYLMVELAAALLFLALAQIDIWPAFGSSSGGVILARFGFHLWLLATLLVAALIEYDGQRLPKSIALIALAAALILSMSVPGVRFELWSGDGPDDRTLATLAACIGGAGGALLGGLVEWIIRKAQNRQRGTREQRITDPSPIATLACVGAFLGGVAAIATSAIALAIYFVANWRAKRFPFAASVALAAIIWIAIAAPRLHSPRAPERGGESHRSTAAAQWPIAPPVADFRGTIATVPPAWPRTSPGSRR